MPTVYVGALPLSGPSSQRTGAAFPGVTLTVPLVMLVVHAFCAEALIEIGVMGIVTALQLHFDVVPACAAELNGQPVFGSLTHNGTLLVGCHQVVQLGNKNVEPAAGHVILLTATVMN
ncbi:MAG TPA: hypothetical protein VF133_12080 [Terriglobales bacterium]